MNRFILEAGAIPILTWLDGTSDGEKSIEELFATGQRERVLHDHRLPVGAHPVDHILQAAAEVNARDQLHALAVE